MGLTSTTASLSALLEAVVPDDVTWWSKYAKSQAFPSEAAARQWVFDRRQHMDTQTFIGKPWGEEANHQFAAEVPVYELRTGHRSRWSKDWLKWKVGRPVRNVTPRWSTKELEVRGNSQYTTSTTPLRPRA